MLRTESTGDIATGPSKLWSTLPLNNGMRLCSSSRKESKIEVSGMFALNFPSIMEKCYERKKILTIHITMKKHT